MSQYLGDDESLRDLEGRMMSPDREEYQAFRHLRVESAFLNRIFVIYRPTGLTADKQHREPEILGQIKVVGFSCSARRGSVISIEDTTTGELMDVGHVPTRLFEYPIFVFSPPFQRIRWDGRMENGFVKRSLAFGIAIKSRTKSDFYSCGATMIESPKGFRALYPGVHLALNFL